ncbi:PREDICTED: protein WVD2-like 7 isoform X2 [Ipomoea nil]|uniref:protein WVD2-like 7 isoform X2 n=1 Tax=Ipomoea nil TaxID=35883 RepID=UPI0009011675|nr:PREDICTED: protein WVD2-like 7 isoform X2 [Ipomoea nil]
MAGDIDEEPFRLNFKLDALNSGSVSFRRFESEGLSWERRSSFSRNRYLEEVEKYSKPGSVTEKKAILEAHFRKRALLSRSSSECQTSENNVSQSTGYEGDFEIVNEGSSQSASFGESTGYDGDDFEHFNGGGYSVNFSNGPYGSSNSVIVISEYFDKEATFCPVTGTVDHEVNEAPLGEGGSIDVIPNIPETSDLHTVDKDGNFSSVPQPSPSPKISSASKTKHLKHSIIPREGSNSKDVSRKPTRRGSDASLRPKREKLSLESVTASTSRSISRIPKHKAPYGSRDKVLNDLKSSNIGNVSRTREKVAPSVHQNANRHKQALSSTKPGMKQNGSGFNFKSEERAERRKEFSMKLEEKMNAKEAEMLQIQARRQKKTEVETRQLRRNLNFKASPLPSFYHEARPLSDKFKTPASKSTPRKPQHYLRASPRTVAAESSPSCSMQTSTTTKYRPTVSSDSSVSSALPTTTNTRGTRKNNEEKKQLTSSLNQRGLGVNKVNNGHKVEVKPKVSAGRNGRTDLRSNVPRGVHSGCSSQITCVVVGVST